MPTGTGELVFASAARSCSESRRDRKVANPQQTDTGRQFLADEKRYRITGGYQNRMAGHEALSDADECPLTENSRVGLDGWWTAEVALAPRSEVL